MTKRVVVVSGGFDPLHSGHIAYFKSARALGDSLVVGLNSDQWLTRKKGQPFMNWDERYEIIRSLDCVDGVVGFDDIDGTACNAIERVNQFYGGAVTIIFANGGDRTLNNSPEQERFQDTTNVEFVFGVGGEDKKNSSSWILDEWKTPKIKRIWGYYRNLHSDGPEVKVKELTVDSGSSLSMQRHTQRNEHWHVSSGTATVKLAETDPLVYTTYIVHKNETIEIPVNTWHQLINDTSQELRVVEIQYGTNCIEEDIERYGVDPYYGKT